MPSAREQQVRAAPPAGKAAVVVGVGIDLVSVGRMKAAITRGGERFLARLFTDRERTDASGPAGDERLAARFAAKEAVFKALGTGWSSGVGWRNVEVVRDSSGKPRLELTGRAAELARGMGATRFHVSLSHHGGMATAVVILEGGT
jgi:holo-[acyl-carrier protein] synthase